MNGRKVYRQWCTWVNPATAPGSDSEEMETVVFERVTDRKCSNWTKVINSKSKKTNAQRFKQHEILIRLIIMKSEPVIRKKETWKPLAGVLVLASLDTATAD